MKNMCDFAIYLILIVAYIVPLAIVAHFLLRIRCIRKGLIKLERKMREMS